MGILSKDCGPRSRSRARAIPVTAVAAVLGGLVGAGATFIAWSMTSGQERRAIEQQAAAEASQWPELLVLAPGLGMAFLLGLAVAFTRAGRRRSMDLEARVRERTEKLQHDNEILSDREEQISSIVNSAAEGILGVDEEGRCTFCNQAAAHLLRYDSPAQVIGSQIHQLVLHSRPDGTAYPLEDSPCVRVAMTGQPVHQDDEVFWRSDRTCFAVEYWCRPLIRCGESRGCIVSFVDITERKVRQRGVEYRTEQASDFDTLFQISMDMIFVGGLDGYMKRVNPAFTEVLGYDERQLLTTPLMDFIHPDDRAGTEAEMSLLIDGCGTQRFENRCRCRDGSYRWLSWNCRVREERLYGIAHDVTEQKRAQHELEQAAQDLARSNAELEQFAYSASHDLQEPLRTITSHLQILTAEYQGQLDADADVSIGFAVDAAQRLRQMIRGLLQYSRVERRMPRRTDVDLNQVLEYVIASLSKAVADAGAHITHDVLPVVRGDASLFTQLLQNLLCNAMKFRGEQRPRIEISWDRDGDRHAVIAVKDNGIGIDSRYTDRVFRIFQRLHRQGEYGGAGIGLALCRRIVERHGGRIWFESAPGDGTTFFFTLPIAEGCNVDEPSDTDTAGGDPSRGGQPERCAPHEASTR